jgi:sarcosine oxidase subunit delta
MLRIDCPYCGPRPESEFQCAGDAARRRPAPDASDADFADYLYVRANPKGAHRERWWHVLGCGQWFEVSRDTTSHEIFASGPIGSVAGSDPQ